MKKTFLIFSFLVLLISLWPTTVARVRPFHEEFIIWNIGQGLWTTWVRKEECWHFDMGGERAATDRVYELCRSKLNRIFLSHWDWDHVGFLKEVRERDWVICLAQAPGGLAFGLKTTLIEGLSPCPVQDREVENLWNVDNGDPPQKPYLKHRSNNHDSHVFLIKKLGVIVAGDSTVDEEKLWSLKIHDPVFGLILGHHGSRTSTGNELLDRLTQLRWTVASQRFKRFHHPHPATVARVHEHHATVLKTEDWGTLRFEY